MSEKKPAEPRVDRRLELHFQGDWGQANLHRILGWLVQELGDRAGPGTRSAIWTGRGFVDNARAVGRGEVDIGLVTPAAFARMALDGSGPYGGEAFPQLRALGTLPQTDRLVLAIVADKGVASFAELRSKRVPLRLATSADDGVNHVGMAVKKILELEGTPLADLESWGGELIASERPGPCLARLRDGAADAVFYEAIMTPWWREAAEKRPLRFLPISEPVLAQLERELGWPSATLPAGFLPGLTEPLRTLDFSDFLLLAREDLPADVAYLLAWCMVERREAIERQYRHIPPERSPVTYPLEPAKIARTAIPLHEGAARFYRERGLIPA